MGTGKEKNTRGEDIWRLLQKKKPVVPTGHEKKQEIFSNPKKRERNDCNERYLSKKEI